MRIIIISIFFLIAIHAKSQNNVVGLYGKCSSMYACQQVLFYADSTFEFYDLLHLSGWKISKGNWQKTADTIILNSFLIPYKIEYIGQSRSDETRILVFGSDTLPLKFSMVKSDYIRKTVDSSGQVSFPRKSLDTISINYVGLYNHPITLDSSKLANCETVKITLNWDYRGEVFFENEKWLLRNKKLYFAQDPKGNFDMEAFYEKTDLKDLKYKP